MAKGDSWKNRNWRPLTPRGMAIKMTKHELKSAPQFSFDQLYIPPFTEQKVWEPDGRWRYVKVERREAPTGIRILDDYARYLAAGHRSVETFLARHGLNNVELSSLVFALTGIKGMRFRQLYQARLADDLLRYTDMAHDEVARRAGLGSENNLYLTLRREHNMSATERRRALRRANDLGRFR